MTVSEYNTHDHPPHVSDRWGSVSNPLLNGYFHYPRPDDIDRPLNEASPHKIPVYRADYNKRPSHPISFIPVVPRTSDRLQCEIQR
jgi:hypothetical protein